MLSSAQPQGIIRRIGLASMTPAPVLQVYLDTVPMPSMEVYSGTPGDATQHFEDWMQTQYSPLTVQLGKWLDLSDNDKATEFLGQLNKYFEQRTALLGEEGTFLFPSRRPSPDALQVLPFCPFLMCTQPHTMRITLICLVLRIHVGGTTPYPICLCLKGKLLPHLQPYFVVLVENGMKCTNCITNTVVSAANKSNAKQTCAAC